MTVHTAFLDFDNRREPRTNYFCVKCQKDLNPEEPHRLVRLVKDNPFIVHPDDYAFDTGDMNFYPVGRDCARKIGLEWTVDAAEAARAEGEI